MQKKLLTLKDFDKVLVAYLYEPDRIQTVIEYTPAGPRPLLEVVKGEKRGVVVAVGPGILGWSLCNTKKQHRTIQSEIGPLSIELPGDKFDKAIGLDKALTRANIASALGPIAREGFYEKVPFSIIDVFEEMEVRAEKYFSKKEE